MALGIFKIAFRLRDQHVFIWQSKEILNVFNTLTLKQIFWKTKTIFIKLKYSFLAESTKIENASFPYKTAISEANVKTNRMARTKWIYYKERRFASNYFFFMEIFFSLKTSYTELIWCTNDPNAQIHTFCKRWSFIWRCFVPLSILKTLLLVVYRVLLEDIVRSMRSVIFMCYFKGCSLHCVWSALNRLYRHG